MVNPSLELPPPIGSYHEELTPFQIHLANSFAMDSNSRGMLDARMTRAIQGETLDDQDQNDFQTNAAHDAAKIAAEFAGSSPEEWDAAKAHIAEALKNRPAVPTMGNPTMPNNAQLGVAALGAIVDPAHAGEIGASPFQYGVQAQGQQYEEAVNAYNAENQSRAEQIRYYENLADDVRATRNDRQNALKELANLEADKQEKRLAHQARLDEMAQNFAQNKELLGMKGEQGETSAAYKAYYNAPDLTVRRKAWEFLANRGEFLPEPTEQTGKEVLTGAQIADTQSKTRERETLLPEKVAKVQAEVQRILGGVQLDDARKQEILQRVQYYPLEFQNRAANILSQIEGRKNKALNPKEKAVNLSDLERLRKIVQDRIDLAGPLRQDPKDLAEMYRLNQMREEILNAKVYGDVGTVAPYNPLSGEIQAKTPGTGFIYNGAGFDRPPKDKPSKTPRKKVSTAEARKRFNY